MPGLSEILVILSVIVAILFLPRLLRADVVAKRRRPVVRVKAKEIEATPGNKVGGFGAARVLQLVGIVWLFVPVFFGGMTAVFLSPESEAVKAMAEAGLVDYVKGFAVLHVVAVTILIFGANWLMKFRLHQGVYWKAFLVAFFLIVGDVAMYLWLHGQM